MGYTRKAHKYHQNYASLKARGVSNKVYTLTIHKNPVRKAGFEFSNDSEKEKQFEKVDSDLTLEERFANSISRSKNAVLQLAANNPWEYFVTLTLRRDSLDFDAYDLESVKKVLLQFFTNYSRRSGAETNFKYLLIPEKHLDGAWHFHGLLMGINPKNLEINKNGYWDFVPYRERFGHFSLGKKDGKATLAELLAFVEGSIFDSSCGMGRINDLNKCASYISKYICKDMLGTDNDNFEAGTHLYFASKGLKKDTVIMVGTPCFSADEFLEAGLVSYENEYCAKVETGDLELAMSWIEPFVNDVVHQIKNMRLTGISTACFMLALKEAFYTHWVDKAMRLPDEPWKLKVPEYEQTALN